MQYNRINRLKQAAELFLLQIIEMGSWVGIVTFHSSATIKTYLQEIVSDSARESLTNYLPTTANGGTSICSGVRAGFQVIFKKLYFLGDILACIMRRLIMWLSTTEINNTKLVAINFINISG